MPEPTPEAWAQIRHDYENTDRPLAHICAEHEVTIPTVRYRMKRWEWTRRKPFVPRHQPPPVPAMQPENAALTPLPACGERSAAGAERGWPGEGAPPHTEPVENPPHPISSPRSEIDLSPHAGRGDDAAIVPRLKAAAARVLPAIEVAIARLASGTLNATDLEKTGRTLATLTRTLRELNALLVQNNAGLDADKSDLPDSYDNIEDFRVALARRIRGLVAAERSAEAGQEAAPDTTNGWPPATAMDGPARA